MSVLQHDLPDATVLDLFAGSGALGLEALSRGARHVTLVELAAAPLRALQQNIQLLGATEEATVVRGDALKYVAALGPASFDIALADPPYGGDGAAELLRAFGRVPFARLLCVEHGARAQLPDLPGTHTRRYGDTALTFITAPE
jgi:16S rRNA (guanine966-N2)-methyltransferase